MLLLVLGGGWQFIGLARADEPDDMAEFLTAVTKDVDSYWMKVFANSGLAEPRVRYMWIPAGQTAASACGDESGTLGDSAAAYCPGWERGSVDVVMSTSSPTRSAVGMGIHTHGSPAAARRRWLERPLRGKMLMHGYERTEEEAMSKVTTDLDERFSDPGAEPTSWDETEVALRDAQLFWISTVRRDGRPHVTPLVAVWDDGGLYFCTGPEEQKAVNLEANPRVALTTGCNGWQDGLDVIVEGEAERVTDEARLSELARAWREKWDGSWEFEPVADGFRHSGGEGIAHVFVVRPAKVLAFGKGPFSHTRHTFPSAPRG